MKKSDVVKLGEPISVNNIIVKNIQVYPTVLDNLKKREDQIIDIVARQYSGATLTPVSPVDNLSDDRYFAEKFQYWEGEISIMFKVQVKGSLLVVIDAEFV